MLSQLKVRPVYEDRQGNTLSVVHKLVRICRPIGGTLRGEADHTCKWSAQDGTLTDYIRLGFRVVDLTSNGSRLV